MLLDDGQLLRERVGLWPGDVGGLSRNEQSQQRTGGDGGETQGNAHIRSPPGAGFCESNRLFFALCSHIVAPGSADYATTAYPGAHTGQRSGGRTAVLPLTKRQREILDYLNEFIQQHGYAPSLEEIGRRFNLSSLATVHKHLTNLQEKGFIRRAWNRSRSVEVVPTRMGVRALELPLLGFLA